MKSLMRLRRLESIRHAGISHQRIFRYPVRPFTSLLALANARHDTRRLQAYLGHKNIQHTVRYTELAPDRFKDFWR
jgi:type 1 fimbriae regulatory protein FimB/type 1 fimbriae regulatory protein FimE